MAKTPSNTKKNLRSHYAGARKADPRPITGKESPSELLEHAFSAYVGRQERTAFELMRRSMEVDASIFLTLSGAMTPAGLHRAASSPSSRRASSRRSPPPAPTSTTMPTASSATPSAR